MLRQLLFASIAGGIGGAVGAGELVSRYKDEPVEALRHSAAKTYIFVNAIVAAGVYTLVRVFGWTFGARGPGPTQATQVLVAAFGSIALLRTSLFTVRVGDQDIGIGPNALLTAILGAADRAVDRYRAEARSRAVGQIMRGISFEKSAVELPGLCLALMQNVSADEQNDLADAVRKIKEMTASDELKSLVLGLALMNVVGEDVLKRAIENLGERIKR